MRTYHILAYILLLASCSVEDVLNIRHDGDALEIKGIQTRVDNGSGQSRAATRAAALTDTVGRLDFYAGDAILFTNIQRTSNPLAAFSYPHAGEEINYGRTNQTSWERISQIPERIYWTDADSPHTFVGYGCPQVDFDWYKAEYGEGVDVYFGSLGNPTDRDGIIDYSNDNNDTPDAYSKKYYSGNAKISQDDILLAYNTAQQSDPGGQVATIHFYHGLSCVRVIVNISGFAASASSDDSKSKVSDLDLMDMRTMYKWNQQSHNCQLLTEQDQSYLDTFYGADATTWNQTKTTRCWVPDPDGVGEGNSKTFTFYGLAVPTTGKTQQIRFFVTYPDPMNPTTNVTKQYTAEIENLEYRAGHCTTINISLNHKNDKMTVGAEYQDWTFIDTPDKSELRKNSTFMASKERSLVTIANDAKATEDDATWLYKAADSKVMDIYGNDGSAAHPYVISTANQLLSFAYEVKNGRSFVHQFIRLDADITMQENITSTALEWIGIGDESHSFDGFFLGNNRHINYLKGKPFFHTVGTNAVIDKIDFAHVISINGSGTIADVNNGLICACAIDGDVTEANGSAGTYCGSFVGDNQSFIIACTHEGGVTGYGYVGGIAGRNAGTIIASYHTGAIKFAEGVSDPDESNKTDGWNIGGSSGAKTPESLVFSCYYNSDFTTHTPSPEAGQAAWVRTTGQMQSNDFVNRDTSLSATQYRDIISGDIITIDNVDKEAYKTLFVHRLCLNDALTIFGKWLASFPAGAAAVTNCRTFTAEQLQFLKEHYSTAHTYRYTPGAYPKIQ